MKYGIAPKDYLTMLEDLQTTLDEESYRKASIIIYHNATKYLD